MDAPFLDGMKVGLGYDILTGSANKSAAVKWDSLTAPPEGAGQIVQTTLQIIQETSQLQQSLGITADARAGNLVADVSAKVKFANDIAVNSFCLYVVVGVRVTNTIQTIDNPTLTNDAADLLKNRNLTRFRERFGDRFVSGIKSGGEYYSVYKVQSLDTTERSSVASKIQARAGSPVVGGVSLDVELSTLKSSSKSKLDVNVFVYQSGGANIATETTLEKIMEKAHAFPTLVAAAQAVPYSVLLSDYTELHLPVDGLSFLQVQNQQEVMDFNAKLIGGFETIINDVDFIRTNLDQFRNADGSPVDDKTLAQVRVNCLQQIDQIRLQMSRCSKDALSCARSLVAPEDYARDLPKIGAPDGKILVPNLVGVNLQRFKLGSLGLGYVPIEAKPVVLDDEFGLLHFVVSIAASDTVPAIPFTPLSSLEVIEQDPPGGGLVESGSSVSLKIKAHNPF